MAFTATPRDGYVHIDFERSNESTTLVDSIVVSPAQYAAWTEADIEAIIEQRWQNYLLLLAPVPEPAPVEEGE
jgi:hypothetical protein